MFQWAFSVLAWEVLSKGAEPYYGMDNLDVRAYVVQRKGVLEMPDCLSQYAEDM